MKTKLIFIMVLMAAFCASRAQGPQIPNGNFSSWTTIVLAPGDTVVDTIGTVIDTSYLPGDSFYIPLDWATIDDVVGDSDGFSFIDTTNVAPGSVASLLLVTDTLTNQSAQEGTIVSFASLGTAVFTGQGFVYTGVPFYFRPDTLFFSYKYTTPGTDSAAVIVNLVVDTGILGTSEGIQFDLGASSTWTNYYVVLTPYYTNSETPDSLNLQFFSTDTTNPNPLIGDSLHITNLRFGYDTILNETVTTDGPTTFCAGTDSVFLTAPTNPAYSFYQWYMNDMNTPIPNANSNFYTAYSEGSYFVIIDSMGTPAVSTPVNVTVNPPPTVSLIAILGTDTGNVFCFPSNPISLAGSPPGGTYSGMGVSESNATYTPYALGSFVLNYTYFDSNTCTAVANDTVTLDVCAGIKGVPEATNLSIYPNPTSTVLNIISGTDLSGYNMQLFDMDGRRVSGEELKGFSNTVNVAVLANEVYMLQVTDAQNAIVKQAKVSVLK